MSLLVSWFYSLFFDFVGKYPRLQEMHTKGFGGEGVTGGLLPGRWIKEGWRVLYHLQYVQLCVSLFQNYTHTHQLSNQGNLRQLSDLSVCCCSSVGIGVRGGEGTQKCDQL